MVLEANRCTALNRVSGECRNQALAFHGLYLMTSELMRIVTLSSLQQCWHDIDQVRRIMDQPSSLGLRDTSRPVNYKWCTDPPLITIMFISSKRRIRCVRPTDTIGHKCVLTAWHRFRTGSDPATVTCLHGWPDFGL